MKLYKYFKDDSLTCDELLEKYNDIYTEAIDCDDVDAANQARVEIENVMKTYNTVEAEKADNSKIVSRKIAGISRELEEKRANKRQLVNKLDKMRSYKL